MAGAVLFERVTMKSAVVVALLAAFLVECVLASQTNDPNWRPPKPRKCGPGEVWKECVSRGCAEKTCPPKEFQGCPSTCEFGCYCADGFFRNPQGRCVRGCSGQSSPVIGKPGPLPDTPFYPPQRPVQHPGLGSQIGPYPARPFPPHSRPQVYPAIFPGHRPHGLPYQDRLYGGGPVRCGPNEEHSTCKSSTCAEATCDNPTVGTICTADCHEGCFCRDGFYRNSRRQCVRKNQCP